MSNCHVCGHPRPPERWLGDQKYKDMWHCTKCGMCHGVPRGNGTLSDGVECVLPHMAITPPSAEQLQQERGAFVLVQATEPDKFAELVSQRLRSGWRMHGVTMCNNHATYPMAVHGELVAPRNPAAVSHVFMYTQAMVRDTL